MVIDSLIMCAYTRVQYLPPASPAKMPVPAPHKLTERLSAATALRQSTVLLQACGNFVKISSVFIPTLEIHHG
jgi:hypothetical protein